MPTEPDEDGFRWYTDEEISDLLIKASQRGFDLEKDESLLASMRISELDKLVNRVQ